MYNRILVAIDLFDLSSVVFQEALKLAKMSGGRLTLLHVLSRDEGGYPSVQPLGVDEAYYERWRAFVQEGLRHLKGFADQAEQEGIEAEMLQEIGRPGHVICATAQNLNIDVIVMGSRGRSGLSELVLGSQSNYVTHHAPCSVLIHRLSDGQTAPAKKA
ncbi:MAG: universal stress protein [Thermosynechococcaceae cyanobacterium]